MKKKCVVIDGHSLAYKSFFAFPITLTWELKPINAVFGFISLMMRVYERYQPDFLIVCFDRKEATFRHELFQEYKAHRPPAPVEFISQVILLKDILKTMGICCLEKATFEADDLMGTLAILGEKEGFHSYIFTGDHDALQLINDDVTIIMNKSADIIEFNSQKVEEVYSLLPSQIIDYKALKGDTSDNIPGVAGIGDKTAVKLLSDFKTLQGVYDHINDIKPEGVKQKLINGKDKAFLSQTLATINTAVPITESWDMFQFSPNWPVILEVFKHYSFKSLYQKYEKNLSEQLQAIPKEAFEKEPEFKSVSENDFLSLVKENQDNYIGLDYSDNKMAVCMAPGVVYHIENPTRLCFEWLHNHHQKIVTFSARALYYAWLSFQMEPKMVGFETGLGYFLLKSSASESNRHITEALDGKVYAPETPCECVYALTLAPLMIDQLKNSDSMALYEFIEAPLSVVLAKMEYLGVSIDLQKLGQLGESVRKKLESLKAVCFSLAGKEFNLNSPKQLSEVLFDDLKLPVIKTTKTGRSTDSSVLEKLKPFHAIAEELLSYRMLEKLSSTYINALPQIVNSKTGKIHTYFNQQIAATGRLSSINPNLQNIPVRSEEGLMIRETFIPSGPNRVMLSADYSQIELRILAQLSRDTNMLDAFAKRLDIHTSTASLIFGVPLDQVSKEQRYKAKAVNFGIIYGISAFGLSEQLGIPAAEAKAIITHYFDQFPAIKTFIQDTLVVAKEKGGVVTEFGRFRPIPELKAPQMATRQFGERAAVNTRIQGTAADIIKMAMINVDQTFTEKKWASSMILQVHDELVFEVEKTEMDDVSTAVKYTMESVVDWDVCLEVDLSIGNNWKEISI